MQDFHPSNIRLLVFDLDSLTVDFDKEAWENFRQLIHILDERDFKTILISQVIDLSNWESYTRLSVLQSTCEVAFKNNSSLSKQDVFWFSENSSLQKKLSNFTRNFAGSNNKTKQYGGLQYQNLYDMLQIFNPSKITATELSNTLFRLKQNSEQVPLLIGIGGPDECGHSIFVGELLDTLEGQNMLVSSLDLSQVLGTEFKKNIKNGSLNIFSYWRSNEIKNWVMEEVLSPYCNGKQVYIETAPSILKDYELTVFPFFLAPEMILLAWGTTVFLPEFEKFFDLRILLELSEKNAAARMFALDDRENFDQSFIDTYLIKEGKFYSEYLKQNDVVKEIDYRINFDNFNAFRFK